AVQAAMLAIQAKRPVQLMWSRGEEMRRGRHGPPAKARLTGRPGPQGQIAAWRARIAAPATAEKLVERLVPGHGPSDAGIAAVDGAMPPYAIPAIAIEHAPADIAIGTGLWRSAAHAYTAFFTESFVDELAIVAGLDGLAFRISLLAQAPRLARCLAQAAASGGWSGEPQSGEGLAVHSAFGSHIALYVEASNEGKALKVERMIAVVDAGRLINPDIVRRQIESGLIWGLASALGNHVSYSRGLADQTSFDALGLPRLRNVPEIRVELVGSHEAPGGVAELGVPVAAPAIANAIFSATGKRLRSLPLAIA
ncbi:MAG TPA: molybdopterin cofactor-binding domain-containing protein, partial [Sphingomonas sp.]|nr:molybdopterin cofactor-binding domain-containing protein [Sphingomonas sp.]